METVLGTVDLAILAAVIAVLVQWVMGEFGLRPKGQRIMALVLSIGISSALVVTSAVASGESVTAQEIATQALKALVAGQAIYGLAINRLRLSRGTGETPASERIPWRAPD